MYHGWTESEVVTELHWQRHLEQRRKAQKAFDEELKRYYSECTCKPWAAELCESCKRANDRRLLDEIPY